MVNVENNNAYQGNLIRKAIRSSDRTFKEVAKKSGVSVPTIYEITRGNDRVQIGKIKAVAECVGVSLCTLFQPELSA